MIFKIVTITIVALSIVSMAQAQSANPAEGLGKQKFAMLKANSTTDVESNYSKFSSCFWGKKEHYNLYTSLKQKGRDYGVKDWNKIVFVDYLYKKFQRNGKNYYSSALVVKLNGTLDYTSLVIFCIDMQDEQNCKILEYYNDNWSRNETADLQRIRQSVNNLENKWNN
jgi:hypothetical protein